MLRRPAFKHGTARNSARPGRPPRPAAAPRAVTDCPFVVSWAAFGGAKKHLSGMASNTVLISGAGIAGPTLAFWLTRAGFRPTLVEHAPTLRASGYVVDFWGLGYDIAERMGLADDVNHVGYHIREMLIVDDNGNRIAGLGTRVFRELTGGRFVTLGRS